MVEINFHPTSVYTRCKKKLLDFYHPARPLVLNDGSLLLTETQLGKAGSVNQRWLYTIKKSNSHRCCSSLVGGFNPSEKYWSKWIISWGMGENKKYLKPQANSIQSIFHCHSTISWREWQTLHPHLRIPISIHTVSPKSGAFHFDFWVELVLVCLHLQPCLYIHILVNICLTCWLLLIYPKNPWDVMGCQKRLFWGPRGVTRRVWCFHRRGQDP